MAVAAPVVGEPPRSDVSPQQTPDQPAGAEDQPPRQPVRRAPRHSPRSPLACQGLRVQHSDQDKPQLSRRDERSADRFAAAAPPPRGWAAGSSVSWALLSQVFWIPLVALDLHDRWVAYRRDVTPPRQALPPGPIAGATSFGLNDLLGADRPVQRPAGQANQVVAAALGVAVPGGTHRVGVRLSSAGSGASSLLDRPFTASLDVPSSPAPSAAAAARAAAAATGPYQAGTLLGRAFTRAQLLGGGIGLADLQEGPMAPLALAERALQRGSGDPLAPLPSFWREPMRQALLRLPGAAPQLSPARMVIVPSGVVRRPVEVPLALQSDGSVDVLEPPGDPAVLREIEGWSRQQRPPATGSLQPALLLLHPLPEVAPLPPDLFERVRAGKDPSLNGSSASTSAVPQRASSQGSSSQTAPHLISAPDAPAAPISLPIDSAAPAAAP